MDKTKLLISLTLFLTVITLSSSAAATNTTIQDTPKAPDPWNTRTGTHYTTIQAAINNAQPGDTIIAETGTYTENIQINKKITLKAQGTPTIKAQDTSQATITITANGATITGFTITNGLRGIYVGAKNCRITNNNIKNNMLQGIHLGCDSSNITISWNNITNNNGTGIRIEGSSNTISGNNIRNNWQGISLEPSSFNKISKNVITNNEGEGIYLLSSSKNTISNNTITNNTCGIYLPYSSNNTISSNTIKNNSGTGIYLSDSEYNTISNNNITNNWDGIYLGYSSNNNIISNNTITNNNGHGIYLYGNYNKVYRNSFIGNQIQAEVESGTGNLFNLSKPTGGNFWSDYTGKDANNDGFGDTPYTFTGGQDNLPLIQPLKILSIDPANKTVSVPLNKTIIVTFNWNIQTGPGYANITVKMANGTAKTLNKTISGNKLIIKATYNWNPGVKFTVTIPKNAIKNKLGKMLASDFKSTFTAAIKVNSIDPANGAVNVPKTKTIVVTFSNNILAGPDYNKITVKLPDGTAKTITKTISGNKLYIKATYNWNPGVKFTVTIPKNAIKNSLGSMLAADFKSTFTAAS